MKNLKNTKLLVMAALCIALGVVLPIALHGIPDAGRILSPMHLPVLLCGLICGWQYGLMCGVITPILSSILTGMPPAAILPGMVAELAVYGLVAGLLVVLIQTKIEYLNILLALLGAMIIGRVVGGLLNAFVFGGGGYTIQLWLTGYFINALPGIVSHIVLVPVLVVLLRKAGLAPKFAKLADKS